MQTVFQFVDLADRIQFTLNEAGQLSLSCSTDEFDGIPEQDNLIVKAAELLKSHPAYIEASLAVSGSASLGVDICIEKHLPQGGGIGGGSSNAATTLWALNELWQLRLSKDELMTLGAQLGADVPIFLFGQSAWAEGVGDHLTTVEIDEPWLILAIPGCHVSTQQIFSHRALTRDSKIKTIAAFLEQGALEQVETAPKVSLNKTKEFRNDCENLVRRLYPEVDEAISLLSKFGEAQMTGTGACVFLLLNSEQEALAVQKQLPSTLKTVVCKAQNVSPLFA